MPESEVFKEKPQAFYFYHSKSVLMILWTVAYQAPPSMGFSRQEYWSGVPLPSPGHLPDPGIEPRSPALQADTLQSEPPEMPVSVTGELKAPGTGKSSIAATMPPKTQHWEHSS